MFVSKQLLDWPVAGISKRINTGSRKRVADDTIVADIISSVGETDEHVKCGIQSRQLLYLMRKVLHETSG